MAEKILTVSEFTQLFQECVPSKTIDKGKLTSALLGTSYTEDSRCPVKTNTINDSGMTTFWQYITNSTIGYAGPPNVYSEMTKNLTNNKLFSLSEITDPRNTYYGGTIGNPSGTVVQISGTPNTTGYTFTGSVELMEYSNTTHSIWTSQANTYSNNGGQSTTSSAANTNKVIYANGNSLQLLLNTTGLTGISGTSAHIYTSGGTIALQPFTTGSTGSRKYAIYQTTLTTDIAKKLTEITKIGVGVRYSGNTTTPSTPSYYVFNVTAPSNLTDTTIPLTPMWNAQGTTLYQTYQASSEMIIEIYEDNFKTSVWVDNNTDAFYDSATRTLKIPWDSIHPTISGKTSSTLYIRVPMKYSPNNNTIVYPVVLYFQLYRTTSSASDAQTYYMASNSKVYLDVSNRYYGGFPNTAMRIDISGASYPPTRYLPNASTNGYQNNGTSLNVYGTGTATLFRDNEPNPHIQYYQNNSSTTLYFKTILDTSQVTTIYSSRTKINLIPQGVPDLAYWVEYLKDEGIQYQITNNSY